MGQAAAERRLALAYFPKQHRAVFAGPLNVFLANLQAQALLLCVATLRVQLTRSKAVWRAHGGAVPLRRSEMNKQQANDNRVNYLPAEIAILGQAEDILRKRLERLGSIDHPEQASSFLRMRLAGLEHEEFHVVFLDARHKIIAVEGLFRGTVDGTEVHPREVVRTAMHHNAVAVILAHNHPSGNPEPSAADRAITARLKQALALVEVRVLDHIVVGATSVSMAARGWV